MLNNYMGIINLNENEENIITLTRNRPLASIPIGGRYRIIDFVMSNMINAGINNIGVFTQSRSRSILDHLGTGKPWDLDRKRNGLFIFNIGISDYTVPDIELFKHNIDYLYLSEQENVILSPSNMICNIDYTKAVKYHEETGSDVTVIYKKINDGTKNFISCDVLNMNKSGRILSVGKNIGVEDNNNISMEMFIMKKQLFINIIYECIKTGYYIYVKDAIYKNVDRLKVTGYEFTGLLECVNSIQSYYKLNMDMLDSDVTKELFFNNGLIYTKAKDEPATKYCENCHVSNSMIANGCLIHGTVENSVIARRVVIEEGAEVKNSIILQNCVIKSNSKLTNIIIDKNVTINEGKILQGDSEIPLVIEKNLIFKGDKNNESPIRSF